MPDALRKAQAAYDTFLSEFRSVVLATVDADGKPGSSYAPCLVDEDGTIWCLVSGLAIHTRNVEATGRASAFFIEDESRAREIFARRRLSYDCEAAILPRDDDAFPGLVERFVERFGRIAEQIAGMPDFRPLRLTPRSGSFVIGFGAAYHVEGGLLTQVTGGGRGHGTGHGTGPGTGDQALTPDVIAAILGHMNGDHAASVLHYARTHGALPSAQAAELVALDGAGMDILATTPRGQQRVRVDFPRPVSSRSEAREVLMTLARSTPTG